MRGLYLAAFLAVLCTGAGVHAKPTTDFDEDNYGPLLDEDAQNDNPPEYYDEREDKIPDANVEKPDDYDPAEDKKPVMISTKGTTFYKYENDTVVLPCEISGSEYVQIWRKNGVILFQSGIKVTDSSNFQQIANGSLRISDFQKKDEGDYECMAIVSPSNSPSIVHQLKFRSPVPHIDVLYAKDNITVLKSDDTLILTCKASGKPKPHISWHKGSERFATEGETLTITNIKHRDAGVYRCLADNNVENPAHAEINIKIEFKPLVTIEKIAVNSDNNFDTELKCIVHAEPRASVVWKKEDHNVVSSPHNQLTNKGHNHILLIKGLQENDFGNYSCSATNYLGTTVKSIKLVKTPAILRFVKPSAEGKEVVLTWEVQSKSPISRHEIEYRKKGSQSWEQVHPEVSDAGEGDVYTVKYRLTGLEPGQYEARIRSQNTHGWSDFSDEMPFEGVYAKHGHHNKHNKKGHKDAREKHITLVEGTKVESPPQENTPPAEHQSFGDTKAAASQPAASGSTTTHLAIPLIVSLMLSVIYLHNRSS